MRTSDLGVWRPSGSLEVVGRRDAMVKVRGARVELGEVESVVRAHPDVRDSVVVVNEDRLVAYIVPAVPATLREHCKERLVAYMVPHLFEGLEELPKLANGKVNKKALPPPATGTGGGEIVMELDSLGKMRKITRASVSEDRVLDNVRAILIAVVIQSHAVPLMPTGPGVLDVASRPIVGALWGPWQYFVLLLSRSGGWPSLAFLAGFDETRGDDAFRVTYRELIFLGLWVLGGFNWSMWFLPAFVYMRVAFVAAKHFGFERTHMLIASQIWLTLPAFVDFYVGWQPVKEGDVIQCPSQCFCPFEAWPWAETAAYYTIGWWSAGTSHSFVGRGLFFIPCYWLGFYCGHRVMPVLTRVADEPKIVTRIAIASAMFVLYILTFTVGRSVEDRFDDRCSSFWQDGHFVWTQTLHNIAYYLANLWAAVLYVVFIAAAVPVHLKYLAKVCFLALVATAYTPCLLDLPQMAMQLRSFLPSAVSPGLELVWMFSVPFLYELVAGAILASALQVLVWLCVVDTSRCKYSNQAASLALRGVSVILVLMVFAAFPHVRQAF